MLAVGASHSMHFDRGLVMLAFWWACSATSYRNFHSRVAEGTPVRAALAPRTRALPFARGAAAAAPDPFPRGEPPREPAARHPCGVGSGLCPGDRSRGIPRGAPADPGALVGGCDATLLAHRGRPGPAGSGAHRSSRGSQRGSQRAGSANRKRVNCSTRNRMAA